MDEHAGGLTHGSIPGFYPTQYFYAPTGHGISQFCQVLGSWKDAGWPVTVFKFWHVWGKRIHHYEYRFHGNGFEAILLLPGNDTDLDIQAEVLIDQVAKISKPLCPNKKPRIRNDFKKPIV